MGVIFVVAGNTFFSLWLMHIFIENSKPKFTFLNVREGNTPQTKLPKFHDIIGKKAAHLEEEEGIHTIYKNMENKGQLL